MKRKRHTEEQIIAILREHEAGMKTADLCRKHGISEPTFYNGKAKYGGLELSEAKRLKGLESENAKLKKLAVISSHAFFPTSSSYSPSSEGPLFSVASVTAARTLSTNSRAK